MATTPLLKVLAEKSSALLLNVVAVAVRVAMVVFAEATVDTVETVLLVPTIVVNDALVTTGDMIVDSVAMELPVDSGSVVVIFCEPDTELPYWLALTEAAVVLAPPPWPGR